MSVVTVKDIFSQEELDLLQKIVDNKNVPTSELHSAFPHEHKDCDRIPEADDPTVGIDKTVGRVQTGLIDSHLTDDIKNKVIKIVSDILGEPCVIAHALHAVYSNEYGMPNLPPHLDGDGNDLIVNFQLSSNIQWDLGVNHEIYSINDNEALVFNANTEIHWRPHKTFNDGDYVQMIFFRCYKLFEKIDYSYMYNTPSIDINKIFADANKVRDSL